MVSSIKMLGVGMVFTLVGALAGAAAADAAKLKISGSPVAVGGSRVAAIAVTNPNRSSARGTLALTWQGAGAGSARFSIPARKARKVNVKLAKGVYDMLAGSGTLKVAAVAKAKGKGSATKGITLTASSNNTAPGPGPGGGSGGGPGQAWVDGRWQGTYAENNANLAFNIRGTRLFTGPFDSFYIEATCRNVNPGYTGPNQVYTDATAIEPVEAVIAGDGRFSGSGTYRPSPTRPMDWTISGRLSGKSLTDGAFSVNYTNGYGDPCSGTTRFTAGWYGDYEL